MDEYKAMDEYKSADSVYDERMKQGKIQKWEPHLPEAGKPRPRRRDPKRPTMPSQQTCEYWTPMGCQASQDAVKLGLAKTIQPCNGRIPPVCSIRTRLAAGKTVKELYEK